MKKLSVAAIVFILALTVATGAMAAVQDSLVGKMVQGVFPVVLNDSTLDKQAIVIDGTSYLPVRAAAEALNMNVSFENNTVILKSTNSPVANRVDGQQFGPPADIAQILGMTSEELQTQLKAGATLEQIAGDKGMTLAQLKEAWLANTKTELDNQVSQGKLTAEQAQSMLTRMKNADLSELGAGPGSQHTAPSDNN